MKKARLMFLAVVEDNVEDASRLYDIEDQTEILNGILKKNIIGSKDMSTDVAYVSREVIGEDGKTERIDTLSWKEKPCGCFECFHCGERAVIWMSDFDFEDYGYEGEGIVQNLVCTNCGAEIEYRVAFGDMDEEGETDCE